MASISAPTPSLVRLTKNFPGGLDVASVVRMRQNIGSPENLGSRDVESMLRDIDRYMRVNDIGSFDANVPNAGESRDVAAAGAGKNPEKDLESLDPAIREATVERGNASNPAAPAPVPTAQRINEAFGKVAYTPHIGLKADKTAGLVELGLPPGADEAVSLRNSPSALAAREIAQLQEQGYQFAPGHTLESVRAARAKEIKQEFTGHGGVWQMNPTKIAHAASLQVEANGYRMTAGEKAAVEAEIRNHFGDNILRSGGQLASNVATPGSTRLLGGLGSMVVGGIASLAGSSVGGLGGMLLGGPIGALAGGALGGGFGSVVGSMLANNSLISPALSMFPGMASNPMFMGPVAALATMGMGGFGGGGTGSLLGGMMGGMMGGMTSAMGILGGMGGGAGTMLAGMSGGPLGAAQFAMNNKASFQHGMMAIEGKIRNLLRQEASLQGDIEMQRMINTYPIEKLIAAFGPKKSEQQGELLRSKIQEFQIADQEEKAEKAKQENRSAISGVVGMAGSIAGMMLGGPVGGMAGGALTSTLSSTLTGGSSTGSGGKPGKSLTGIQFEIQMLMEEWKRGIEMMSNTAKAMHDMQMTIINNIR